MGRPNKQTKLWVIVLQSLKNSSKNVMDRLNTTIYVYINNQKGQILCRSPTSRLVIPICNPYWHIARIMQINNYEHDIILFFYDPNKISYIFYEQKEQ